MNRIILPAKRLSDSYFQPFDYTSVLSAGETISSIAFATSIVYWGNDPNPSAVIGPHTFTSNVVNQGLLGGVLGTIYTIAVNVLTSAGNNYTLVGALAIIPDLQ